jgi:transcriptional regulator with XRE-family HTH domain
MVNELSSNQLRAHRKRSGLSQHEVAAILGCEDGGAISRYERSHNLPPLPLAVGYEVMFLVPVSQLFSGLLEAVEQATEDRLSKLEVELGNRSGIGHQAAITAKKLQWLMERRNERAGRLI